MATASVPIASLKLGDCLDIMRGLSDASFDSLITDPPAGIAFMGKDWDKDKGGRDEWVAWMTEVMAECLRVLKPGAHGLVWALPRTSHWTATALEDAGFEVRDCISHLFGTGFAKSLNVEKAATKGGMTCVCSQEVQSVQQDVDAKGPLSSGSERNLQQDMQRESDKQGKKREASQGGGDLQVLPEGILDKVQGAERSDLLLTHMQDRLVDGQRRQGALAVDCPSRESRVDESKPGQLSRENERRHEPSMGGRPLCETRPGIHYDSNAESPECSAERLCVRACDSDGTENQTPSEAWRRDPSYQSRSSGQSAGEPQALPESQGALASAPQGRLYCRQCGKIKAESLKGLGSALKPAAEFWWLIRKPLSEKTVAANVLKHGTGAVNIDASRISTGGEVVWKVPESDKVSGSLMVFDKPGAGSDSMYKNKGGREGTPLGRFPANLILSHNHDCEADADGTETVPAWRCTEGCAVAELDRQSGVSTSPGKVTRGGKRQQDFGMSEQRDVPCPSDTGGASRFFYCAKASKRDRGEGNTHPTVKSTQLMRYLCRLITPPGGTVLDPFAGSGSTGIAALAEGFSFMGIDQEQEYLEISKRRLEAQAREMFAG